MSATATETVTRKHRVNTGTDRQVVDPALLWYVPHRRLRSRQAAADAIQLVDSLGGALPCMQKVDEHQLFVSLHTCAYWASGASRTQNLSMRERQVWFERWNRVRNYIADANVGLVYSMMEQVQSTHRDWDGMTSEGMYALLRAVDRFDPWQGYKFSTYACNIIVRALLRYRKTVVKHQDRYVTTYEGGFERPEPEADLNLEINLDRLERVLSDNAADLTGMESDVLAMRFPESGVEGKTFKEIGHKVGLSKERVRQIQHQALEKLRSALCKDTLVAWH